jgi:hypothetical protein
MISELKQKAEPAKIGIFNESGGFRGYNGFV